MANVGGEPIPVNVAPVAPSYGHHRIAVSSVDPALTDAFFAEKRRGINMRGFEYAHISVAPAGGANPDIEILTWNEGLNRFVLHSSFSGLGADVGYEVDAPVGGSFMLVRVSALAAGTCDVYVSGGEATSSSSSSSSASSALANTSSIFVSNTEFVNVPHAAGQNNADALSVFIWAKYVVGSDANDTMFTKWTFNSAGAWAVQLGGVSLNRPLIFIATTPTDNGSGCNITTVANDLLVVDTWHHVGFVFNSGAVAIYVDGVLQTNVVTGTIPATLQTPAAPIRIGTWDGSLANRLWNGNLDEATIWHAALTPTEVAALYNGGAPVDPRSLSISGLVGYWPLGNAPGDFATTNEVEELVSGWNGVLVNGDSANRSADVPTAP